MAFRSWALLLQKAVGHPLVSRKKGHYHTIIPNRQRNQPRDDDSVNLVADRRKNEAPGWPRRGLAMGWWCG